VVENIAVPKGKKMTGLDQMLSFTFKPNKNKAIYYLTNQSKT
jgi:hypothetical protein